MALRVLGLWLALCAAQATAAVGGDCTWRHPGHDPYTGTVSAAVMRFDHIRYDKRLILAMKVRWHEPSDLLDIGRDTIQGSARYSYDSSLNGMHFGRGRVCATVTRDGWAADHTEPARAWCLERWCVVIPDVCGNVAWTVRDATPLAAAGAQARAVPEPGSVWLVILCGLAAGAARRMRHRC